LLSFIDTCRSAEAAIALRQRLNESVDQLDSLRKEHADLEIRFESQNKELIIAKSDRKTFLYLSYSILISQWLNDSHFG
jgi:hypothetical protein